MSSSQLQCIESNCRASYPAASRIYTCERCGGLLDVVYDLGSLKGGELKSVWDGRRASLNAADQSGVLRFRELLPEADESQIVTMIEGNTQLFDAPRSAEYGGLARLTY